MIREVIGTALISGCLGFFVGYAIAERETKKVIGVAKTLLYEASLHEGGKIRPQIAAWAAKKLRVIR